eukprot:1765047-Amphidinium_carterae.1
MGGSGSTPVQLIGLDGDWPLVACILHPHQECTHACSVPDESPLHWSRGYSNKKSNRRELVAAPRNHATLSGYL